MLWLVMNKRGTSTNCENNGYWSCFIFTWTDLHATLKNQTTYFVLPTDRLYSWISTLRNKFSMDIVKVYEAPLDRSHIDWNSWILQYKQGGSLYELLWVLYYIQLNGLHPSCTNVLVLMTEKRCLVLRCYKRVW
jgi:hypothetical protein